MMRGWWLALLCTLASARQGRLRVQRALGADPFKEVMHDAKKFGNLAKDTFTRDNPQKRETNPDLEYDATPKSPKAAPEISTEDEGEKLDWLAAKIAKNVDPDVVTGGMPGHFNGGTCKEVCLACMIAASDYPSCGCRATCLEGNDGTICKGTRKGWSNEWVTVPEESWRAHCNYGAKVCKTDPACIDDETKADMKACEIDETPSICYHKLKLKYALSQPKEQYCLRIKEGGTCEPFPFMPKGEEVGWKCFKDQEECQESQKTQAESLREEVGNLEAEIPNRETPSVWLPIFEKGTK